MYRNQFIRVALASVGTVLVWGGLNNSPAASQSFDLGAFQDSVLAEHNIYRSTHHSPALNLDRGAIKKARFLDTSRAIVQMNLLQGKAFACKPCTLAN